MQKILIVDDNVDSLEVLKMVLSDSGYRVDIVSDWQKTYHQIILSKPDLILMDISLDGIDGRILSRVIKSNDLTKDIRIILVSGHEGMKEPYETYLADDFIEKPLDINNLLMKIKFQLSTQTNVET